MVARTDSSFFPRKKRQTRHAHTRKRAYTHRAIAYSVKRTPAPAVAQIPESDKWVLIKRVPPTFAPTQRRAHLSSLLFTPSRIGEREKERQLRVISTLRASLMRSIELVLESGWERKVLDTFLSPQAKTKRPHAAAFDAAVFRSRAANWPRPPDRVRNESEKCGERRRVKLY